MRRWSRLSVAELSEGCVSHWADENWHTQAIAHFLSTSVLLLGAERPSQLSPGEWYWPHQFDVDYFHFLQWEKRGQSNRKWISLSPQPRLTPVIVTLCFLPSLFHSILCGYLKSIHSHVHALHVATLVNVSTLMHENRKCERWRTQRQTQQQTHKNTLKEWARYIDTQAITVCDTQSLKSYFMTHVLI